jgi:hypothetical protein
MIRGEQHTLQVMHPLFTFGLEARTLFVALESPSDELRLYNSMGVGCTSIIGDGNVSRAIAKSKWCVVLQRYGPPEN